MSKFQSLFQKLNFDSVKDALSEIFARFPVPFIMAVFCFIYSAFLIYDAVPFDDNINFKIIMICVGSFFLLTSLTLYKESHGMSGRNFFVGTIGIIAGLTVINVFAFANNEEYFFILVGACFLTIQAAPYLFKNNDTISYWFYNQKAGIAIALGFLVGLIFFLGMAAAVAGVDYLFGFKTDEETYALMWAFAATILGPLYTLYHLPKTFVTTLEEGKALSPITFIGNWILSPLVILYLVILYAYFIKIAVTMEVPKNELSGLIVGFGLAGIVTYKIGWIYEAVGQAGGMVKFLQKYFFPLMIIPTLMLFYAIGVRIYEYGVTEERYIVLAAALWFAFLTVGIISKKLQLKYMTISVILIAFFSAWGPWGMQSVSKFSQTSRLESLLEKHDLLKGGKIIAAEENAVSNEDAYSIHSIARHIWRKYYRENDGATLYGYKNVSEFMKAANIEIDHNYRYDQRRAERNKREGRFEYKVQHKSNGGAALVSGYDYYMSSLYANDRKRSLNDKVGKRFAVAGVVDDNILEINFRDYGDVQISLQEILADALKNNPDQKKVDSYYVVTGGNNQVSVRYEIFTMNGKMDGKLSDITYVTGRLFVKVK